MASLKSSRQRLALRHGVTANASHIRLLRRLRPEFIIDVGANRGQFALAALVASDDSRVVSFEPLSAASERYGRAVHDERVTLRQLALGSQSGTARIYVSAQDDSSSLLEITELQSCTFPGTALKATADVPVSTLDQEIAEVPLRTLLKLDVQGFELEVLQGARRLLREVDWVLCEVSFREFYRNQATADQIIVDLSRHGMRLQSIEHVTFVNGVSVQADLLFERDDVDRRR